MKLVGIVLLPAVAASLAVMILLIGPWCAWKFMGIESILCAVLFSLEIVGAIAGGAFMLDWMEGRNEG